MKRSTTCSLSILVTYSWTFKTDYSLYSAFSTNAPFSYRVLWRFFVLIPELLTTTKIAALLVFLIIITTALYYLDEKQQLFFSLLFILGSINFMYLSDCLVLLAIVLIKKYPCLSIASALVHEQVLLHSLFYADSKMKYFSIPLYLLIRILFFAPYLYDHTSIIQFVNYPLYPVQTAFWGLLLITACYLLFVSTSAIQVEEKDKLFLITWNALIILGGNIWEINKQLVNFDVVAGENTDTSSSVHSRIPVAETILDEGY